jgi:hypothetical protein
VKKTKPSKPTASRPLTAAEKRRWHEEWVDKVILPDIGGLSRRRASCPVSSAGFFARLPAAGAAPRKWDADRKLELLTDYELLRKEGFKASEAHSVLNDAAGTSKVREYLRDARKLFPRKKAKKS